MGIGILCPVLARRQRDDIQSWEKLIVYVCAIALVFQYHWDHELQLDTKRQALYFPVQLLCALGLGNRLDIGLAGLLGELGMGRLPDLGFVSFIFKMELDSFGSCSFGFFVRGETVLRSRSVYRGDFCRGLLGLLSGKFSKELGFDSGSLQPNVFSYGRHSMIRAFSRVVLAL